MKILRLNSISNLANPILENGYEYSDKVDDPDGIILRSFVMHDYAAGDNLLAVARAGAGVNNIPVPAMTEKGIVVFNTPGANANAVAELVICALLLGSRKIYDGINWVQGLKGQTGVAKMVEAGKSKFTGGEIMDKTLGVLGLGAIGTKVANDASALGMNVIGYDPYLSIENALTMTRKIKLAKNRDELISQSDYLSIHMPLTADTKGFINKEMLHKMKDGIVIINCSRGELVNNADLIDAVKSGKVSTYVTDFPTEDLLGYENIITIPHLGASTPQAEDNCAVMAAKQLTDYLENGNIVNSVNFPDVGSPRTAPHRITIVHANRQGMIATATSILNSLKINISNMISASRGDVAYMMIDTDSNIPESAIEQFAKIEGFTRVRVID
jgi:D-3-phosphoglycerate dehydrogenase